MSRDNAATRYAVMLYVETDAEPIEVAATIASALDFKHVGSIVVAPVETFSWEDPDPAAASVYAVWDHTTNNLLGEFDTRQEAEERIERIRPLGRYGPEGHKLEVWELDEDGRRL